MNLSQLERSFNRAWYLSFSIKKLILVFPILVLCGVFIVFCRALAFHSGGWISMSMIFLPIFFCSGILLALGVLLIRIYYHEVKQIKISYKHIITTSWDLVIGTSSYLSLPVILTYLLFWMILGVFLLFHEIPVVGPYIGVILSFAPFVLIFLSILLGIFNVGMLFFVTPIVGLKKVIKTKHMAKKVLENLKERLFMCLLNFIIAILPIAFIVGVLTLAAIITKTNFFITKELLTVVLEWFFIMLPFCFFLAPCVIFFFNFSLEAYNFLQKGNKS